MCIENLVSSQSRVHVFEGLLVLCHTISRRLQSEKTYLPRSIPLHGFCSNHLSRKFARYRNLPVCREQKLYHICIRGKVSRSTIADPNEQKSGKLYADPAYLLINAARKLYSGENRSLSSWNKRPTRSIPQP